MRRGAFGRSLLRRGCYLFRHSGRHDIYANGATGQKAPVPRHPEIKESLVRLIERQLGL